MPAGAQMKSRDLVLGYKSGHEVPVCTPFFFRSGAVQCFVLVAKLMFQNGVWQGELEYLDPGSQIVGMTRQWKARENMSAWSGKRDRAVAGKRKGEREIFAALPLPSFLPFYLRVRAFSISRTRLFWSLEQARAGITMYNHRVLKEWTQHYFVPLRRAEYLA